MICLTGDVHHVMGPKNSVEIEATEQYHSITQKYGIKVTFFVTGKTFVKHSEIVKKFLESDNLEIGGHTWSAFRPKLLHAAFKKITGSVYGPSFYQERDIKKTLEIIKKKTGIQPLAWRTHCYDSDDKTLKILEKYGIRVVSDEVNMSKLSPTRISDSLVSLPINVIPDDIYLINASYPKEKYYEMVISQIEKIESENKIATLQLHPIHMKSIDNFELFEKLCKFISKYNTIWVSDGIL